MDELIGGAIPLRGRAAFRVALETLLSAYRRGPSELMEAFRTLYQDHAGKVLP